MIQFNSTHIDKQYFLKVKNQTKKKLKKIWFSNLMRMQQNIKLWKLRKNIAHNKQKQTNEQKKLSNTPNSLSHPPSMLFVIY